MKYLQALIWSIIVLVAGGCASYQPTHQEGINRIGGSQPLLGQKETIDVGDSIVQQFEYHKHFGAHLEGLYDRPFPLGKIIVGPDVFFQSIMRISDPDDVHYCSATGHYSQWGIPFSKYRVCFKDSGRDGFFDEVLVVGSGVMLERWRDIEGEKPAYTKTDIATPVESASDYKQELIYQGLSGGSLKVAYREYVDSLARPAFTQVVEYDNQEPPFEIAFKGARITVHSATSNELVYTVTKGLVRN